MKLHHRYLSFLMACCFLFSCKKDGVKAPEFDVKVDKMTYKVGEPVIFNFIGNPNYVSFFSGELGNNYINLQRTHQIGTSILQFTSSLAGGSQIGNLKLMVSTDFNGIYTAENIAKANWTDISSRAVISTGTSNTPSGPVDLSDFAALDKRIYLGYYYYAPKNTLKPRGMTVSSVVITNTLSDKTVTQVVPNFLAAGFVGVDLQNPLYKWTVSSTSMQMPSVVVGEDTNEDWCISTAINLNTVQPDYSVAVKGVDSRVLNYSYAFKSAGVYTTTFVAANINVNDDKRLVKTLQLTITP